VNDDDGGVETVNRNQRIGLVVAAVAVAVVAFVLLRPGDDEPERASTTATQATQTQETTTGEQPTTTQPPTATTGQPTRQPYERIALRDGQPVGGVKEISVRSGEVVRLEFSSNVADEMHIHGFDRYVDVPAGGRARVRFPADIDGVFEIESHDFGTQVAELEVRP
jgi:FtsP/CotA-like multicopper oxidase with cupredoxin domain